MGKKVFWLILIMMLMMVFPGAVCAQDVDISDMDNAQLMQLLQAIMQKLEATETVVPEELPDPSETPIPVIDSGTGRFSIWKNKKLMIEALPDYMFVPRSQGETEDEPGPDKNPKQPTKAPEHYNNEPDIDDKGVPCHWYFVEGKWYCMYG